MARWLLPTLLVPGLVLSLGALAWGMAYAPPDHLMGVTVKILVIHVPCVWLGMAGIPYAILATVLGLFYLGYTIRFSRILRATGETESRMYARDLLKVSVIYLPLLLTGLMLAATVK